MKKTLTTLLFLVAILGVKLQAMPVDSCVAVLLRNDEALRDSATERLVGMNNPQTYAFISAILEKRLYENNGKAYTKFPGEDVYVEIYPNENGPVQGEVSFKEIQHSRKIRTKFNELTKYVNLVNKNPDARSMAYMAFKSGGELKDIEIIETFLAKEANEEVKATAQEVIYAIWLMSNDAALQGKALNELQKAPTYQVLETVQNYLEKAQLSETDERFIKANDIIGSIQSHQSTISTIQNLFSGLSLGSILLLVALGLSIIYGLGGVINMSHGEFMMIGAYTAFSMQQFFINVLPESWFDFYFIVSLPLSFLVAGIFGIIVEQLVIKYLYNRPLESLIATWGVSLILIQLSRTVFGDVTAVKSPEFLAGGIEIMDGLILPFNRLFIIGLTVVMVFITYLGFFKSRLGLKIRAVTQNRNMSASLGISTKRVDTATFFLGSGLAGIAGCAMTLIGNVVPNMGQTYIVDSFLVVVVGGVGKLIGTIISAMGIGILSKIFEFFFEAVYGKVIMLAIIIFFLQYKPKGMFPDKGRIGDD